MNNIKKQKTILARQEKERQLVLEHLHKIPIVQVACERAGVSRASYYRWRNGDSDFLHATDEAIIEGEKLINDMSESQLISLIRDKNGSAIKYWLQHHHPKYAGQFKSFSSVKEAEKLTPEQEKILERALKLVSFNPKENEG